MFIDLNRKVDFNKEPYDTNRNFAIYSISDKGLKDYISSNHFTHHYLNKYSKEALEMINNDLNGYQYEEAEAWGKMEKERREKEKNSSNNNTINQNDNQTKKRIEFEEKPQKKLYDNEKEIINNTKVKVTTNKKVQKNNNILDNDFFCNNNNNTQPFRTYKNNIEKFAKFSSSVSNIKINSKKIEQRFYPKVQSSK